MRSIFLAAIVAFGAACVSSAGVTIVANPGPFGTIERAATAEEEVNWSDDDPADDIACTESFAALELRGLLPKASDLSPNEIRLAAPERMPAEGDILLLATGESNPLVNAFPEAARADFAAELPGSFRMKTFPHGGRTITVIKGRDRAGTLYGAYAYLEKLGMRFYGLGEQGTVCPAKSGPLPSQLDTAERPSYLTRGFWAWEDNGNRPFSTWMARNRLNFWCAADRKNFSYNKKIGMKLTAGGHGIQFQCLNPQAEYPYRRAGIPGDNAKPDDPYKPSPQSTGDANQDGKLSYFEAHPEWFGLVGGKRSNKNTGDFGDNYCTSNADATAELVRNLVRECVAGTWRDADVLQFWMLDNGKWCQCEACKAQGTCTDRTLQVVDAALRGLADAHRRGVLKREIEISTLAYHETLPPPSKPLPPGFDYAHCSVTYFPIERCYVHPLADPACTEINRQLEEDYRGWTTGAGRFYTGSIFIGEYYNVSSLKSLPVLFPRIMATDIPWYYRHGARHFHYMHVPTRLWGTWTLNQYLMARLLWDAGTNADALLDEYFARYYPTTSAETRAFYRELEYATANCKAFKHYVGAGGKRWFLKNALASSQGPLFPLDHLHEEPHHPLLNDGPDLEEIAAAIGRARRHLDEARRTCRDAVEKDRLAEDERRFAYGEATIEFIHRLARTAVRQRQNDPAGAGAEFALAERAAEKLERIVDLVQVSSTHANAKNGFDAAGLDRVYQSFKQRYGTAAVAPPAVPRAPSEGPTVPAQGRKKGWLNQHEKLVEKVKQGKADLIFIGDSITKRWEDSASGGGWPGSPQEIWAKYYGRRNAVNLGIGSDRTQHVLWRLEHGEIDGIAPNLAVVLIGTNNTETDSWEEIAAGIEKIVALLRKKLPQTKILLMGIFPWAKDNVQPAKEEIAKINARIARLNDGESVIIRDIGARFLDKDGTIDKELLFDGVHPTARGYEIWAKAIESDVVNLLGEKAPQAKDAK
jgi:lysophospholipase L1-like esterase